MINWDNVWTLVVAFVICLVIYYVEKMLWGAIKSGTRRRHR
jgi:hypothetical protein